MDYFLILVLTSISSLQHFSAADEKVILDTRNATSDLGWPTSGPGWTELTSSDGSEADLRTFQVCGIRFPDQNNWLRTPFQLREGAERIHVEIKFAIRSCEGMSGIVSCKETFNLYYLASNEAGDPRSDHMDVATYTKVDNIAADERFKPDKTRVNTETRIITPPTDKRGFYLAFQDTGACMTILYVRIFYKRCRETINNLATFPVTLTGPQMTSLVDVTGTCVDNAILPKSGPDPSLHCNGEGKWSVPSGNCICEPGYEPDDDLTKCTGCELGKFKSEAGNHKCRVCPQNSFSISYKSTTCSCSSGFFRAPEDRPGVPCTKPPSKPVTPECVVNKTSLTITWSEPRDQGGRSDTTYSISCERCDPGYSMCSPCEMGVDFYPRKTGITRTKLIVRDLTPRTHYRFKIFSRNGVSEASGKTPQSAEIRIRTNQAAPSIVPPVRVISVGPRYVILQWGIPAMSKSPIVDYQVQYSSNRGIRDNVTSSTTYRLDDLTPSTSYIVQVRARSEAGFGLYSRATAFRTKTDHVTAAPNHHLSAPPGGHGVVVEGPLDGAKERSPPDNENLIIAIAGICGIVLITLGLMFLLCRHRHHYKKASCQDLEKYPGYINSSVDLMSTKTYVDPSTYEDPYIAVQEFAKEIDFTLVKIEQVIGRGEFGEVCKGSLVPSRGRVAIKTLKAGYNNQEKLDFLGEASIMGQFDHPNVIRLEGVVTKSRPLMIITEFMENGSLDDYLRANEGKLTPNQLTLILQNIATGMRYLSNMGYVHRDLAARNILVNAQLICKVSDFGLSRVLENTNEEEVAMYTTRGGMIPIRWTAPEAITRRTFTSSSDVWSFGIVTWEVLSFGERPYWEMSNQDVVHFVESGYRLPPPCRCPQPLHALMLECWSSDRALRPNFEQIATLLQRFLEDDDFLRHTLNNRPFRDQDDCIPEILDLSSLGQWLEQMHLLHRKWAMLRHGCVTAEQIMRLTPSDCERMGITEHDDVTTIVREAEVLRKKIEEVNVVGIAV